MLQIRALNVKFTNKQEISFVFVFISFAGHKFLGTQSNGRYVIPMFEIIVH